MENMIKETIWVTMDQIIKAMIISKVIEYRKENEIIYARINYEDSKKVVICQ